MDLMRLVKSLEEFLYAVMTWLIFYPKTLWLVVNRPRTVAGRVAEEMNRPPEEQFADLMSPPLFLVLSIFLVHLAEVGLHERIVDPNSASSLAKELLGSEQLILVFRSIVYSLFPLLMASSLLRRRGLPIDRDTLRGPFFLQCFYVVPFAIATSGASVLARLNSTVYVTAALVVALIGSAWYVALQAYWFRTELQVTRLRSYGIAILLFLSGIALTCALAIIFLTGKG